jgi:plasmid stabilization system protein ParE
MKLRFSRRALHQIDEIADHVADESPRIADLVLRWIEMVAALIARYPAIGRPTSKDQVRVFSLAPYPYLLFYQTNEARGEVVVLRVRHTGRRQYWREGR